MARAMFNGEVIAEAEDYETVEGNAYFPPEAVKREFFQDSEHRTVCPWKGTAHYYDVVVGGRTAPNGAWYYPDPLEAAASIKDHVAFWGEIEVEPSA